MAENHDSMGRVAVLHGSKLPSKIVAPELQLDSKIWRAGSFLSDGVWPPDLTPRDLDVRQVEASVGHLTTALAGASPKGIAVELESLSIQYWTKDFTENDAKIMVKQWAEDFAHIPLDILQEACRIWRRTQNWYPKPAELLATIEPLLAKRREALKCARAVLNALTKPKGEKTSHIGTDEQEADIQAKVADLVRRGSDNLAVPDDAKASLDHFKASAEAYRIRRRGSQSSLRQER